MDIPTARGQVAHTTLPTQARASRVSGSRSATAADRAPATRVGSPQSSAPQDTLAVAGEGAGTRTYTLKLLLEKTFGIVTDAPQASAATAQSSSVRDLQAGQTVSLSRLSELSVTIVRTEATQVTFSAEVDGKQLEIQATRLSVETLRIEAITTQEQDPLVLDLAGDGIDLRPVDQGVGFDIDADGVRETSGFVQGDDALLVMDRGADGALGGADLFGNQHGAANGFEELRRFDGNADGRIDAGDAVYSRLRVYQDLNGDGSAQSEELRSLSEVGIAAISLDYATAAETSGGQRITQVGSYVRTDGTTGRAADALLKYREVGA